MVCFTGVDVYFLGWLVDLTVHVFRINGLFHPVSVYFPSVSGPPLVVPVVEGVVELLDSSDYGVIVGPTVPC